MSKRQVHTEVVLGSDAGMTEDDISYYEPAFTHDETRIAARITGVAVSPRQ